MSCQICTENFNKSTNSIVTCSHCSEDCCKNCVRTYLMGLEDEPQCMFCKNEHDMIFLASNLNKSWVHGTYKKHREKVLLDKQVAQLPDTQDKARRVKIVKQLTKEIEKLNTTKKELQSSIKDINTKIREHHGQIQRLFYNTERKEAIVFTFKCPNECCSGFLDSSWVCGLCDKKTCKDCMEIITTEDHTCDTAKVETVKLIRKDTKPCPGCGEFIHKIHGCDQMWCPGCKVAFSWRTGQIEKGVIHNPEYYRWMREHNEEIPQPRNNNDCGQVPDANFLLRSIRTLWVPSGPANRQVDVKNVHILYNTHRLIQHIAMLENLYRRETTQRDSRLEELRVKYLLNEIDKNNWMIKIQALDKAFKKCTDNIYIWRLIRDTALPLLWYTVEQFHDTSDKKQIEDRIVNNVFPQLEKIRLFCNESFRRIGNLYGSDCEIITELWTNMGYRNYKKSIAQ